MGMGMGMASCDSLCLVRARREGAYVRVFGNLRTFMNKRSVQACLVCITRPALMHDALSRACPLTPPVFRCDGMQVPHMEPITDYNEVTFHMLEALKCHVKAVGGKAPAGPAVCICTPTPRGICFCIWQGHSRGAGPKRGGAALCRHGHCAGGCFGVGGFTRGTHFIPAAWQCRGGDGVCVRRPA
jgi:hypothetical protein